MREQCSCAGAAAHLPSNVKGTAAGAVCMHGLRLHRHGAAGTAGAQLLCSVHLKARDTSGIGVCITNVCLTRAVPAGQQPPASLPPLPPSCPLRSAQPAPPAPAVPGSCR